MGKIGPKLTGMILAAGKGERMSPLTFYLPKPLLPVLGSSIFEIAVRKLERLGVERIHANLHHLPEAMEKYASDKNLSIVFHRESEILGTAGGIGNMASELEDCDLVILNNGDTISNIDLSKAIEFHMDRSALVTLVLLPQGPKANVAVAQHGEIIGIGKAFEGKASMLGYSGMAVLSVESLLFFPRKRKADLVEILNEMIEERKGSVFGWNAAISNPEYAWADCGSAAGYLDLHRKILIDRVEFDPNIPIPDGAIYREEGAIIECNAVLAGFCSIGKEAIIEAGAMVEDCVVLEGAKISSRETHRREIIFRQGFIRG